MQAVPNLIRFLTSLEEGSNGRVQPPAELRHVVKEIFVREHRLPNRRPMFTVSRAVHVRDYTIRRITEKLGQHYESDAPIELLAWVDAALPEFVWKEESTQLLCESLPASVFRRVWVFERGHQRILFAYPQAGAWAREHS